MDECLRDEVEGVLWKKLAETGEGSLIGELGRRQDAFAAEFSARNGDAETRKVLRIVSEREAVDGQPRLCSVYQSVTAPPTESVTTGNANVGSLTCFSEQ